MNKKKVTLKTHEVDAVNHLEVIGQGGMVDQPCQIGDWWITPAEQYTGTIPQDIINKWDAFKELDVPVLGYLIADDMREVLLKRAQELEEALMISRKAEAELQEKFLNQQEQIEIERQDATLRKDAKKRIELVRQEKEQRQEIARLKLASQEAEERAKASLAVIAQEIDIAGVSAMIATGAVGFVALGILAILRFNSLLIAVMDDGRWVCVAASWD